jgi:hypothetical protein
MWNDEETVKTGTYFTGTLHVGRETINRPEPFVRVQYSVLLLGGLYNTKFGGLLTFTYFELDTGFPFFERR